MSRTGSMLIVNQRRPNDLKKAYQAQDELLKIAIANDANIAKARKDFKNQEPVFLTARQALSPEELLQDESLQTQNALSNLLDIGFRDIEAKQIVSIMSVEPDLIYKFNLVAKAIKEDVKKRFDVKILTPAYFMDYLTRYIDELDESNGLQPVANSHIKNKFDALTRNLRDIYETLPKKTDLQDTANILEHIIRQADRRQRDTILYTEETLRDLIRNLPTREELAESQSLDQVDRMELLQNLQNIIDQLPTTEDITELNEILQNSQYTITQRIDAIDNVLGNVNQRLTDDLKEIKDSLKFSSSSSASFSVGSTPESRKVSPEPRRKVPKSSPNATGRFSTIPFNLGSTTGESEPETTTRPKKGKGMTIRKIGKGIAVPTQLKHLEFGKYVIDKHRLDNQNTLHFKHKSLGATKFKPLVISDDTKELVSNMLDTGKLNHKHFDALPDNEKSYLYNVINGAGLLDYFKIKNVGKDDENRFEVLRGEYMSGNNSVSLIRELKALIVKFSNEGKITKRQMTDLLLEIS